jgi:hypothetical protein
MNENVFIAWGGNQSLAMAGARRLQQHRFSAIVGGGSPTKMFIGDQVLTQMDVCSQAILLVEKARDPHNGLSNNLMFEWGYLVARLSPDHMHVFLINMSSKDLPSDLMGSWTLTIDDIGESSSERDERLADQVSETFIANCSRAELVEKLDIINNWPDIKMKLDAWKQYPEHIVAEYILFSLLSVYYHDENAVLREMLNRISGSDELNRLVVFAKAYLDTFINSANMSTPLSVEAFFNLSETFSSILQREGSPASELEVWLNILCQDVFGLSCLLFARNDELDQDTKKHYYDEAIRLNLAAIADIEKDLESDPESQCIGSLLEGYLYRDIAQSYKEGHYLDGDQKYAEFLELSVGKRRDAHDQFVLMCPHGHFVADKLEQEYILALCEQCRYIEDPFRRKLTVAAIERKMAVWMDEIDAKSFLTQRIRRTIESIKPAE